jgi:RNA polymerase sigma factor for flagellar operon FliA
MAHDDVDGAPTPPLPREVALRYIPIIRRAALRLARRLPPGVCVDDLVGVGFVALVQVFRRADTSRPTELDALVDQRVRGAMIDELRARDPLSRDARALAKRVAAGRHALGQRLGREPTHEELAAALGLELDELHTANARVHAGPSRSLEALAEADAAFDVPDAAAEPVDELCALHEDASALALAVSALPPRLRQILELYYGADLRLRDIGATLGVSESRVSQLHAEAIARLRASVGAHATDARATPARFDVPEEKRARAAALRARRGAR